MSYKVLYNPMRSNEMILFGDTLLNMSINVKKNCHTQSI